jgi:hypothetical protein
VIVKLAVLLANVAPVASNVPLEELDGLLIRLGQCLEGNGGGDDLAEGKPRLSFDDHWRSIRGEFVERR